MLRWISLIVLVAAAVLAQAQDRAEQTRQLVLDHLAQTGAMGATVAIVQGGELVFDEGFGWENEALGRPATRWTKIRLGSISKPITAVAVMQLVEAGKIELDADVRRYVPEFPHSVTIQQLLSHTGGVRHYIAGKPDDPQKEYRTAVASLEVFGADPLLHRPGAEYDYSTHAFTLLAAVVERASGHTFTRYVREHISIRAGAGTLTPEKLHLAIPFRSVPYSRLGNRAVPPPRIQNNSWKFGGGGFESTASDLAWFGYAVLKGELVSSSAVAQMWTKQRLANGEEVGYGLGWSPVRGNWGHAGGQQGSHTLLVVYPEGDGAMVLMINTSASDVMALGEKLEGLWFGPN